ncbi:aminoglycoside phosphotransferase family protein [Georgenia sp. MJ206]|uniref:phosphotransferase family protein n=1 Tax=Georgenia wangjunii TaxID=3117730 RepID=UPI002F25F8EA
MTDAGPARAGASRVPVRALVDAVAAGLRRPVTADDWRPAVQGAVGHVVGLSDAEGATYVAKVYAADAHRRAETEEVALRLLRDVDGVPAPDVVLVDALPGGRPFVLLTRLPGVRWADRRARLDRAEHAELLREVADVLRRVHAVRGSRFGSVGSVGSVGSRAEHRRATAWDRLGDVLARELPAFLSHGGSPDLARRVRDHVLRRRDLFPAELAPTLCHNDLNGGNVLVTPTGKARVTGVVDLERASWDDPLSDLALTVRHVRQHDPSLVPTLLERYGLADGGASERLETHVLLGVLAERTWVALDRPPGWAATVAALDAVLEETAEG